MTTPDDDLCTGCCGSGYDSNREARCHCQPPLPMTTPDAAMLWARQRAGKGTHPRQAEALMRGERDYLPAIEIGAEAHRAGQAHIAARLRERADAATGSAQAVLYEIARMIEAGEV